MTTKEFNMIDPKFRRQQEIVRVNPKDIVPGDVARYFDFSNDADPLQCYTVSPRHQLIAPCFFCNKRSVVIIPSNGYYQYFVRGSADAAFLFPHLTREEVEVLISGIHPDCWAENMKEEK